MRCMSRRRPCCQGRTPRTACRASACTTRTCASPADTTRTRSTSPRPRAPGTICQLGTGSTQSPHRGSPRPSRRAPGPYARCWDGAPRLQWRKLRHPPRRTDPRPSTPSFALKSTSSPPRTGGMRSKRRHIPSVGKPRRMPWRGRARLLPRRMPCTLPHRTAHSSQARTASKTTHRALCPESKRCTRISQDPIARPLRTGS